MNCTHINVTKALFILFSIFFQRTQMVADNHMESITKHLNQKNSTPHDTVTFSPKISIGDSILHCEADKDCINLHPPCISCDMNTNCIYGNEMNVTCNVHLLVQCKGSRSLQKSMLCRYCYQTEPWEHTCELKANCNSAATPKAYYRTNCTVNNDVLCLGHRTFFKNVRCNWTDGYRWSTALILSITLGGFGADRFYLGHWQEGIGKLFSFGGLGVWTIVDVVLISLHYLGPADGSLYI
ncbi:hypothetical protein RN001_000456 [Aquatica leii]|uniref:TM2 domain-containing protein n=1 Tax=Aquatica leii TaxID=1421715 RepID=A0AAN7P9Z4_9COLE|nr:hypothetical protein RN001_000456 [Aquatica leii]